MSSVHIKSGPGGFENKGWQEGLEKIHALGLDAAEVEFVYGVNMNAETAKALGDLAKKLGISLSIHAPYYINLASEDKAKIAASKKRIIDSVRSGHEMGAEFVVFHPAFYGKRTPEETYALAKEAIVGMLAEIKKNKWTPKIATETTGKPSQFGSLEELERLSAETGCAVCVDFAHLKARHNGVIDYDKVMTTIAKIKPGHLTSHFSGIEWTEKGERNHKPTDEALIKELLSYLKKHGIGTQQHPLRIINESPQPSEDAALTLKIAKKMGMAE